MKKLLFILIIIILNNSLFAQTDLESLLRKIKIIQQEGQKLYKKKQYALAIETFKKIDIIQKKIYNDFSINKKGRKPESFGRDSYLYIAKSYQKLKKYSKSLEYYNKVFHFTSDYKYKVTLYSEIASLYIDKKEYQKALSNYSRSLIYTHHPDFFPIRFDLKIKIATMYTKMQQHQKALEYLEEFLKEIETDYANSSTKNLIMAHLLYEMSNFAFKSSNMKQSLEYAQNSLKFYRKELNEHHIIIANIYAHLSQVYVASENYPQALKYQESSIVIKKKNNVKPSEMHIRYANLASIYYHLDNYEKSLFYFEKAIKIAKNSLEDDDPIIAKYYSNISALYADIGNIKLSDQYQNKAIEIKKTEANSDNISLANSYNNLAMSYLQKDQYKLSLKYLQKTIHLLEQSNHSMQLALAYANLAALYADMNEYEKSIQANQKSIKLKIKLDGSNSELLAINYNTYGKIYTKNRQYQKALNYFQKSITLLKKKKKTKEIHLITTYNDIAFCNYYLSEYQQAYEYIMKSLELNAKKRNKSLLLLDSTNKLNYNIQYNMNNLLLFAYAYQLVIFGENNIKSIQSNTLNHWLTYKGSAGEGSNLLGMLEINASPKTKEDIKQLKKLNVELANLYFAPKDTADAIKSIEKKISTIELRLNKTSEKFREYKKLKSIAYQDISALLKPNQLYIDFAKMEDYYYLFSLDAQNSIVFKQLSKQDTKDLEAYIQTFREINSQMSNAKNNNVTLAKQSKQKLYYIYKLLAHYIDFKSNQELLISPDGLLNFLPFEALYDGKEYLIEKVNISYIPSGRELVRQSRREVQKEVDDIVVFAYPYYGLYRKEAIDTTTKSFTFSKNLEPLKGSKEEMFNIQKLFPKATLYHSEDASVENLLKVKSPKILHLSTHGLFVDDSNITNPMQQVILAFANANYSRLEGNYSGVATALKLSTLELKDTRLVYLSACDTGLGKVQQAEGVQGLPKAFIQAGAKNVIMSLWSVDDSATTTLTTYFYQNIKSGMGYKEALRSAKLKMIDLHPYFWSGFILNGL